MVKKKKRFDSINFDIMEELRKVANDAFNREDYLSSAIIIFQMLEGFLRMQISWCARNNNVCEEVIEIASEDEQSFSRLVLHFDLVKPDNGLSKRLYKFGRDRNKIMHELFHFKSFDSLKKEMHNFCKEGLNLSEILMKLTNAYKKQ